MTTRLTKLNDHLRDEAGKVLLTELRGGEALVTVIRADVSRTLEHATVYISVLPVTQSRTVLAKIRQQIYFLQQALNQRLAMRPVPKVKFEIDHSVEQLARLAQILEKTK